MHLPSFPQDGRCACGAVQYRLSEDPLEVHACHCHDCQRVCGTAFVLSMAVHLRSLEVVKGDPVRFAFKTPEGIARCDQRCADCGCRLWSEIDGLDDIRMLRPGTLDDTRWIRPIAHIWTSSAQPWVEIPDDVLSFSEQPDDHLKLVRAWKGRGGA
jgi:hypothetical protein